MGRVNQSRDVTGIVRSHTHRIEDRERAVVTPARTENEETIPFANSGPMSPGRSTPHVARKGGQVVAFPIHARAAATSGSSTFQIRVNDVLVGNVVTLAASANDVNAYAGNIRVSPGDVVDIECLTAGTGLADVGGHITMKG